MLGIMQYMFMRFACRYQIRNQKRK